MLRLPLSMRRKFRGEAALRVVFLLSTIALRTSFARGPPLDAFRVDVAENDDHNEAFAVADDDDVPGHRNDVVVDDDPHRRSECLILVDRSNHCDDEYPRSGGGGGGDTASVHRFASEEKLSSFLMQRFLPSRTRVHDDDNDDDGGNHRGVGGGGGGVLGLPLFLVSSLSRHVKATVLTVVLAVATASRFAAEEPRVGVSVVVVAYLLYLSEAAFACSTRRYLSNVVTAPSPLRERLDGWTSARPTITWTVECYHHARDGRSISEGGGHEHHRRKVVTHRAVRDFRVEEGAWRDDTAVSPALRRLASDDAFRGRSTLSKPFVKIRCTKTVLLRENAMRRYLSEQRLFYQAEAWRDRCAELSTSVRVDGFRSNLLADRSPRRPDRTTLGGLTIGADGFSKRTSLRSFWIWTMLGLTVPYRAWFARRCDDEPVDVSLSKEILW